MFFKEVIAFLNRSQSRSSEQQVHGIPVFVNWKLNFIDTVAEDWSNGEIYKLRLYFESV